MPPFAFGSWALRALLVGGLAGASAGVLRYGLHPSDIFKAGETLTVSAGLGINQVSVTGFKNTLSDDIFQALRTDQAGSILVYDTAAARLRLQNLAWVQSAQVTRALPDGLTVTLRERTPFAVWQYHQLMFLIDAEGRTLEPTSRGEHKQLPLVVGAGADASARELMTSLARHPGILVRLEAAVRVANRRWDLELKDAPSLLLPEQGMDVALSTVEVMQRDERVFDRRLAAIDLRVAGRIAFRVVPEAPRAAARATQVHSGGA